VIANQLASAWSQVTHGGRLPVVQLCCEADVVPQSIAADACARLGLNLHVMSVHSLPLDPRELIALMRLWEREAALSGSALMLECEDLDASDNARARAISRMIESTHAALIVASRERFSARQRHIITLDVHRPSTKEQRTLWENALGPAGAHLDGRVDALVSQFSLTVSAIQSASNEALGRVNEDDSSSNGSTNGTTDELAKALWDACRKQKRPKLSNMAQRIEPAAGWEDLVLPEDQRQILREIGIHVRQRMKVYDTWGFAAKSPRGLGISALFVGPSGTGKTMAAEVLANDLKLDLYRIDLSQVVSKYIGETEKNLRQVFDAAEGGGAVLLFDEADALFGKRSEVKDSHDRYANIEISYLLQRMETYGGLAILTTNMKGALDQSFLRRIRFIVQFPFPDAMQRAQIWERILPRETPSEGIEITKLARLNVAGGNIRNIAMHAAFLAADAGEPVHMNHLLRAAQVEYAKLEKPLTQSEIGGWL
jgi:SpoVK/Ycf46/Vps4 family AAA+-type ATPase